MVLYPRMINLGNFWFLRTQHPHLLPFNQPNHPRPGNADLASASTQAQHQPSAPPSPSFPNFSPTTHSNRSTPLPSMPPGLIPQDPRLPSLYLPSYDEAVNMQSEYSICSEWVSLNSWFENKEKSTTWKMSIFQVVVVKQVTNIFIGFRMSGYYTTEPPDDSDDDLLTVLLCIGCGSVGLLILVYLCCCCVSIWPNIARIANAVQCHSVVTL